VIHFGALAVFGAISFIFFPFLKLDKHFLWYLFRYLSPFLIALFIALPINLLFNNQYDYSQLTPVGRIANLVLFTTVMIQVNRMYSDGIVSFKDLLGCYFFANLIMMLSAIWQALDFYTGFPVSFPLETRSFLH